MDELAGEEADVIVRLVHRIGIDPVRQASSTASKWQDTGADPKKQLA